MKRHISLRCFGVGLFWLPAWNYSTISAWMLPNSKFETANGRIRAQDSGYRHFTLLNTTGVKSRCSCVLRVHILYARVYRVCVSVRHAHFVATFGSRRAPLSISGKEQCNNARQRVAFVFRLAPELVTVYGFTAISIVGTPSPSATFTL